MYKKRPFQYEKRPFYYEATVSKPRKLASIFEGLGRKSFKKIQAGKPVLRISEKSKSVLSGLPYNYSHPVICQDQVPDSQYERIH